MFGHSVAIHNNTIFIGAPTKDYGDVWDVGAIYVFVKQPGQAWSSRSETIKILPRVKDERELFGWSLKSLGNTLIAGAPGSDFAKNGFARNKPGRAYIFQAKDYFWQDVEPLLDFTGDSFVKDYFGLAVNMDESDFFIGAPIEDIDNARLSGSVYITETPPIVKLFPPVCANSNELVDLFGYPFGGTWSGPGLVDVVEGTFDPQIAGSGTHEFTYQTPSCSRTGVVRIEVVQPPQALLEGDVLHKVCQGAAVSFDIGVQYEAGVYYSWFYRSDSTGSFQPLQLWSRTLTASQRGEYQALVYNSACEVFSPVVKIHDEVLDVFIDPVDIICEDVDGGTVLHGNPEGGNFAGQHVSDNRFFSSGLANAAYLVRYHYESPMGCNYEVVDTITINKPEKPLIGKEKRFCIDGFVQLSVQNTSGIENYEWMMKPVGADDFMPVGIDTSSISVEYPGAYQVRGSNTDCTIISDPFDVHQEFLQVQLRHKSGSLCKEGVVNLLAEGAVGINTFAWKFKEEGSDSFYLLDETGRSLETSQAGVYQIDRSSKNCRISSDPYAVVMDNFSPAMAPSETLIKSCFGAQPSFYFEGLQDASFEWYRSDSDDEEGEFISRKGGEFTATSSGFYYAVVKRGICTFKTPYKQVIIFEKDSVFIPNIITPNGDQWNNEFKVIGFSVEDIEMTIMNRYGKIVYHDTTNRGWNGDGQASGVYFWYVSYVTCPGERINRKGMVHLVR